MNSFDVFVIKGFTVYKYFFKGIVLIIIILGFGEQSGFIRVWVRISYLDPGPD